MDSLVAKTSVSFFPQMLEKPNPVRVKSQSESLHSAWVTLKPNSTGSTHSGRCKRSRPAWWGRVMVSVATQPRSSSAAHSSAATGLIVNKQRHDGHKWNMTLFLHSLGGVSGRHGDNTHPGRTGAGGGRPATPPTRLWCRRWTRCSRIPPATGWWWTVGRTFGPPSAFQSRGSGCPEKWHIWLITRLDINPPKQMCASDTGLKNIPDIAARPYLGGNETDVGRRSATNVTCAVNLAFWQLH